MLTSLCLGNISWAQPAECPAPPPREVIKINYTPKLDFSGDQTLIDDSKIVLKGNVRVSFQNRVILAEELIYDSNERSIAVEGAFRVRQDELEIEGRNLRIVNNDELSGEAVTVYRFVGDGWRVKADKIELDRMGNLRLEGINASTCVEGDESWSIGIREIDSQANAGYGKARGIRLRIAGKTVFFLPYTVFPRNSDRRSGWLFPRFDYSSDGGLNLEANYYFNLAKNYDLTLGVGTHTARGPTVGGEFRYLGDSSELELSGTWLSQDAEYITPRKEPEDRWIGVLKYRNQLTEDLSLNVIGQRVSDKQYLRDFSVDLDSEAYDLLYLRSALNLGYSSDTAAYHLISDHYQSLVSGEGDWSRPTAVIFQNHHKTASDWYLNLDGRLESFMIGRSQTGNIQQISERLGISRRFTRVQAGKKIRRPHIYLDSYLALNNLVHQLDNNATRAYAMDYSDQTQTEAALDLRLYLDRSLQGGGMVAVSPRLYYLYREEGEQTQVPRIDSGRVLPSKQQLFQPRNWYGYDRLGENNRLALGVDWSFYNRQSRLYLQLGIARNENLETPAIYGLGDQTFLELNLYPGPRSQLYAQVQHSDTGVARETLGLSVLGSRHRGLQLTWHRVSDKVPEPDAGMEAMVMMFWTPLSKRFGLFAGGSLDLVQDRELQLLSGVQYRSCCWTFRLANLQYERVPGENLDQRNQYVFEFRMHGLGSLGRNLHSAIRRWIPWINEREVK